MNVTLYGGPWHGQTVTLSSEIAERGVLEVLGPPRPDDSTPVLFSRWPVAPVEKHVYRRPGWAHGTGTFVHEGVLV